MGESQTYAFNQRLCWPGRRTPALKKWSVGRGGDSRITRLPSKAAGRLKRVCVTLNIAGVGGWASIWRCVFLFLDLEKISSLIGSTLVFLFFFLFYHKGHKLVERFVMKSINISPCAEPMGWDAFFFFSIWKNLGPSIIRWVLSCPVN